MKELFASNPGIIICGGSIKIYVERTHITSFRVPQHYACSNTNIESRCG